MATRFHNRAPAARPAAEPIRAIGKRRTLGVLRKPDILACYRQRVLEVADDVGACVDRFVAVAA